MLQIVKSSYSSGTSHIAPDGWPSDQSEMTMACGVVLKRSKSVQIKTFGAVTCVSCVDHVKALAS